MSEVIADTVAPETAPQTETIAPTSAPEVAAAETPAEAPAPNIDDELSAIFRKANPDRESDGKYAAKDKPEEADKPPEPELPQMPASWAKANEQVWKELTPAARDIFLKREADSTKGVEQLKQQYEPIKGLAAAIEPHRAMLSQNGLTAEVAVQRLISAHEAMSGPNKHQAILHLAEQYGVDLPRMFGPQGQRPGQNAFVDNLVAKINRLEAAAAAQEQAQVQTVQKTLTSEIESFSKKPEYEHFETLKPEMAKLLIAGVADGLEDAYDKAARLNKDVFTQIQSKSTKAAEDKARAEAAKKAASLNVKSSSANSASPKPIDDQLREIYRRSQAS
jgi:hypothetical protein